MRHKEVIYLIGVTVPKDANGHPVTDDVGNPVTIETERQRFAEELAVFSTEFYNAAVTGLRPSKQFEIYTREYQGEDRLKHNNITYRIIRSSLGKTPEKTRLTCERVAADG